MSIKSNIKKILFLSLGILAGSGLLVLLIAAINKKNHKNCTGINITFKGNNAALVLNKPDVINFIAPDKTDPPEGKPLASFDLKKMETALKEDAWIKDGQLFFDNNGVLRITVYERTPVARIFTVSGNSFYIDSTGKQLPLNAKLNIKLPVFTNFPADKETLYSADSLLMQQIRRMAPFIRANPFWAAQIGQVDITPNRTFEMIPVIGKHLIVFGDGNNYEQKFHRLFLFYQQVSAKVGLDKYTIINVAFDKQVVATKKGTTGKIDSIQTLKNIRKLIESTKQLPYDTVSTMVDNNIATSASSVPTLTILKDKQKNTVIKDSLNHVPSSIHPTSMKSHTIRPLQIMQKPKAL
jgi:cell division protein FtsQ